MELFRVDYSARGERLQFNYAINVSLYDASCMASHIFACGGHEHDADEILSVSIRPMKMKRITIYKDGELYAIWVSKAQALDIFRREMYDIEQEINLYCDGKLKAHWSVNGTGHAERGWSYA